MEKKKQAAAMAAVYMYIRTGEEAAASAPAQVAEPGPVTLAPVAAMNVWGLSGRQAIMNANTMMQMRMFK